MMDTDTRDARDAALRDVTDSELDAASPQVEQTTASQRARAAVRHQRAASGTAVQRVDDSSP